MSTTSAGREWREGVLDRYVASRGRYTVLGGERWLVGRRCRGGERCRGGDLRRCGDGVHRCLGLAVVERWRRRGERGRRWLRVGLLWDA